MLEVTAVNLTPDLQGARADLGPHHLGALSADRLSALLESLRSLDSAEVNRADPHLLIDTRAGRRVIRPGGGRLFLYPSPESRTPLAEIEPNEAMDALTRPAAWLSTVDAHGRRLWQLRTLAAGILAAGLVAAAAILHVSLGDVRIEPPPSVQPIQNERELTGLRLSVVGRYTTGREPGDRGIEIGTNRVQFTRHCVSGERVEASDTYRIGRCDDGRTCLSTTSNGLIEVRDIDTLVYYRTTYRRLR